MFSEARVETARLPFDRLEARLEVTPGLSKVACHSRAQSIDMLSPRFEHVLLALPSTRSSSSRKSPQTISLFPWGYLRFSIILPHKYWQFGFCHKPLNALTN
jgi:hypothetical protein